ncbi:MAG: glycosyltransferase family 2 protein [Pseudomonadota bacterium]
MIEARNLFGTTLEHVTVLDLLAGPAGSDGHRDVRMFLAKGLDPKQLESRPDLAVQTVTSVAGGLMVRATWDATDDTLPVPVKGSAARLRPAMPEPALLAGRRVLLAQRNGQSVAQVADWLRFHTRLHGAEGALILDRARPEEPPLAEQLLEALDGLPRGMDRVLVVSSPLPLGQGPSERHVFQAPDAPGKDRMDRPDDDPWTGEFKQLILLEALRWRFLTHARSVAFVDISDILAPAPRGRTAFTLAEQAKDGVIQLIGRRIYPWRVRKGQEPRFGDHICDQFDNPGGNRRWAIRPDRIPDDQPLRLVRVGGIQADPLQSAFFYRAMALRVTEAGGMPLAPKTSLVLDKDLLDLAKDTFGQDPILPPVSEAEVPRLPASVPGRTGIITCMKNEGPFILEWIAYHRAIGVDDFLVYTNDCTDGTDRLLDLLQGHGILQHRDNPFRQMQGMRPQHAALAAAEAEPLMARLGWAICMDVDEFLNIHVGGGHLADLYAHVGDANMISCTWRLFGNSDLHEFEDMPTPARFTRCAPQLIRKPHQAWGFKTLFRNLGIYKKMGVHRPKGLKPDLWEQISWVNGSGKPMPKEMLRNGWRSTMDTYGYDLVTLNHYAVRDAESFLVKRDRGRVNHVERDQGLGYWFRMNNNAVEDRSIQRMLPALEAEISALKALPGVAEQHNACVAAHRARIKALRDGAAFETFYQEITGPRLERLSRMHQHFGANVFLAGPDSVPDHVAAQDVAPDFFFTVDDVDKTAH